ncbi:MAG: VWA domain-containing protein [Candidatus Eremiobacteraeota bacterium]|nr:VWA domain-containing protein [Candidatus Eremiobacteraeota bacterium]MBV8374329.1 VWA domain-containing protein [Candidatus Eremiobacteraeota bacterium]
MTLDRPGWLVAGIVVLIGLAVAYERFAHRRTASDLAYSNVAFFLGATKAKTWIPRIIEGLWLLAAASVVLAVTGPHLTLPIPAKDGQVFICIDTSGSMRSTDVAPTREEAAKAAARAFIAETPPGTKVGIISFSGSASVVAPLSADRDRISQALDDVPLPDGATAIGDALRLAAQNLPERGHRVVILVTDGVNNSGIDPSEVAQWLGAHHIPVYTIGIGTPNGGIIPGTNEEATIDEDALRSYAELSGGAYARTEDANQLHDALAQLGRITTIERKPVDASLGIAIAGAIGMVIAFLAGLGLGRYP